MLATMVLSSWATSTPLARLKERRVTIFRPSCGREMGPQGSSNSAGPTQLIKKITNKAMTCIFQVPDTIEDIKVRHIKEYGGAVVKFGNADKAEEFHESGDFPLESANLFHEILLQLENDGGQDVKVPHYFVHAAGTGSFTVKV
ncbi:hypothetical protein COOONC_25614 [Cooperia oncophora]